MSREGVTIVHCFHYIHCDEDAYLRRRDTSVIFGETLLDETHDEEVRLPRVHNNESNSSVMVINNCTSSAYNV